MSSFDLKPLTTETIEEMNFNKEDLWLIRWQGEEFGPFETESLKHYSSENKDLLIDAEARRLDQEEFKEFWSHPTFQRRKMQVLSPNDEGAEEFWIMHQGLKAGPFSFKEIDKKIEMDLLARTDLISTDDGDSWVKIFQLQQFDRRSHHPNDLPIAPREDEFSEAHLRVIDELENKKTNISEEVAELAFGATHSAKIIPFKTEDVVYHAPKEYKAPSKKKWVLPTAIALAGALFIGQEFLIEENPVAEMAEVSSPSFQRRPAAKMPNAPKPHYAPTIHQRAPASIRPAAPSIERMDNSPRYPTIIESHEDEFGNNSGYEQEEPQSPVVEGEAGPKEYSLVGNDTYAPQSLEAVMGGEAQEPVVEEVSDF